MKHIITAMALIGATSAQAYIYTGNALLERIQSNDPNDRRVAMAYMAGVVDALDQITHCMTPGVKLNQVRDLVHAELTRNPEQLHDDASIVVGRVLYLTWPCKKGQP